ncbi:MAG: hypothetical protein HY074_05960 [Deltaproteobacteria bacterium]|nr:hypothetical protein [Deltaproteobacteria bacterium]
MLRPLILTLLMLVLCRDVFAGDICNYYRSHSPEIYKAICGGRNQRTSPAGTHSAFSDSFNLNAAALPTQPSSYGLEVIGSYLRSDLAAWNPTFALIKGFHKIGTGISTSGNNTFYGNDVPQRLFGPAQLTTFKPIEPATGHLSNLNVGTSLSLLDSPRRLSMRLGVSARYNNTTNTVGGGPAVLMGTEHFTLGVGVTRERVSNLVASMYFGSAQVSARFLFFELEYLLLKQSGDLGLDAIHIVTCTAMLGRFTATAAMRRLNYLREGTVQQPHLALQVLLSKGISLAYLYNYIPGASSVALQYFL